MKSGSRTKNPKKEDDIVRITVVIDMCNDKEVNETNSSVSSASGSEEEDKDRGCHPRHHDFSKAAQKLKSGRKFGNFMLISKMPHVVEIFNCFVNF